VIDNVAICPIAFNAFEELKTKLGWLQGRLGFALKAAEGLCVFGYVVGQELEGHKAIEFYILSFVDDAHTAAAEFLDNQRGANCLCLMTSGWRQEGQRTLSEDESKAVLSSQIEGTQSSFSDLTLFESAEAQRSAGRRSQQSAK
jgi:hypothetical protein